MSLLFPVQLVIRSVFARFLLVRCEGLDSGLAAHVRPRTALGGSGSCGGQTSQALDPQGTGRSPSPQTNKGTRGGRSSQRKRQAYQRYIFQDSRERGSDEYLDPSFVPFFRPDGTSRAYKFIAPTTPPDYVDVETFRSSQVQQPSTPASSSSSRVKLVKPAAKKILTQDIPQRLAPHIPKARRLQHRSFIALVLERGRLLRKGTIVG